MVGGCDREIAPDIGQRGQHQVDAERVHRHQRGDEHHEGARTEIGGGGFVHTVP